MRVRSSKPLPWWPHFHGEGIELGVRGQLRLHWRANVRMLRRPRAVACFLLLGLAPAGLWIGGAELLGRALPRGGVPVGALAAEPRLLAYLLLLPPWLWLQHTAFVRATTRWYTPRLREALAEEGVAVCIACGQLGVVGGGRCPECGAPAGDERPLRR